MSDQIIFKRYEIKYLLTGEEPFYKEKLRLRSYGVASLDSTVFVELKKKYDAVVYKRRIAMTEEQAMDYLISRKPVMDCQVSREIDYCMSHYEHLTPKVLLSYDRAAFYAMDDHNFRITFDENILWRDSEVNLTSGIFGTPILEPGQSLMEIKTAGAIPLWLVKVLSANRIYKTSFSKYGTAYRMMLADGRHPVITHTAETATISGGTIVAVGASGMAQNFSTDSTQGSMLITVADSSLTGDLTLTDSKGTTLVSCTPSKAYNSVLISCPSLKKDETYTLTTGEVTTEVEMTSLIYGTDNRGMGKGGFR